MPFAGLDVHKKEVEAAIIDDEGRLVYRERFACTREQLIRFATSKRCQPLLAKAWVPCASVSTSPPNLQ
jgi:hypothetical protein